MNICVVLKEKEAVKLLESMNNIVWLDKINVSCITYTRSFRVKRYNWDRKLFDESANFRYDYL